MYSLLKSIFLNTMPIWIITPFAQLKKKLVNVYVEFVDPESGQLIRMIKRRDSFIEKTIHANGLYGSWEKESLKIWALLSKQSDVIIDIGSNTGIYSLLAAANNHKAKIIAIEPVPLNYNILKQNIKVNKSKIKSVKIAISNTSGKAVMHMLKNHINYMTSVNKNRYAEHPEIQNNIETQIITIKIEPFNYIIDKYKLTTLDLIKLDVEGHEIEVLQSMMPYIQQSKPCVLIEIIDDTIAAFVEMQFRKLNYCFVAINEQSVSTVVSKIWNNDHHNFLLCSPQHLNMLRANNLVV